MRIKIKAIKHKSRKWFGFTSGSKGKRGGKPSNGTYHRKFNFTTQEGDYIKYGWPQDCRTKREIQRSDDLKLMKYEENNI
jgi:hypothetical protein